MLSSANQRPNTGGFGNVNEDGRRGNRESRGGFQGRGFRGQDNYEVRNPRGMPLTNVFKYIAYYITDIVTCVIV